VNKCKYVYIERTFYFHITTKLKPTFKVFDADILQSLPESLFIAFNVFKLKALFYKHVILFLYIICLCQKLIYHLLIHTRLANSNNEMRRMGPRNGVGNRSTPQREMRPP